MLIDRGEYDRAIAMAERGGTASDRFIDENLSAYQMTGKSQGSYARGRAHGRGSGRLGAVPEEGLRAARRESSGRPRRLSQGQDFVNQFHLGELERAQNVPARARDHYLDALSLAGGPAPLRQRATEALAGSAEQAAGAGGFDAWLETELTRRRDERRAAALKSLVDHRCRSCTLTTVDGDPYDATSLQRESPAAELLRLLVRGLPCGVTAPQSVVREISERPGRGVPARQHRRGLQAPAALSERDEVPVSGGAHRRGRRRSR